MLMRFAILIALSIYLFEANSVVAEEWVTIGQSEQHLSFGLERIVGWERTTKKRYLLNSRIRQEWTSYRDSKNRQVLQIFVQELQGGYSLSRTLDIDDAMSVFNKLKSITRPAVKENFNGLGKVKYGFFKLEGKSCVIIFQNFGDANTARLDHGIAYLTGVYCDLNGDEIGESKAISLVKAIGFVEISGPMGSSNDEAIWQYSNSSSNAKSVASATPSTNSANEQKEISIAFLWGNSGSPMLGKMTVSLNRGRGRLVLGFEDNGKKITCNGNWQYISGSYGSEKQPNGTWALACKNGQTATGTYISHENLHGKCIGLDDQGRSVTCTY